MIICWMSASPDAVCVVTRNVYLSAEKSACEPAADESHDFGPPASAPTGSLGALVGYGREALRAVVVAVRQREVGAEARAEGARPLCTGRR